MATRVTVRSGQCLSSIAHDARCSVDFLWNAPENAALRARRSDPNLLAPGDVVVVPDRAPAPHAGATGGVHRFTLRRETVKVRIRLVAPDAEPGDTALRVTERPGETEYVEPELRAVTVRGLARVPYVVSGGPSTRRGSSDGDGVIELELPAHVEHLRLVLEPGTPRERAMLVHVGALDPADEPSGVAQRLHNLGYAPGSAADVASHAYRDALAGFQRDAGLRVTGVADDATRARLAREHRS